MQQPLTRQRTSLFLSYRDSQTRRSSSYNASNDDEGAHLINQGHVALDLTPPSWVDISEQVEQLLVSAQSKISTLDKLHAKHILPGFADRSQEERDIEAITTDITRDFSRCKHLIQRIGAPPHVFPPHPQLSTNELLAGTNLQRGLAAKLQVLSAVFRKKQRVYMERLQGHAAKHQDLLVASGAISLKGPDAMSALDDDIRAANHTRAQSQSQSLIHHDDPTQDLQARDRELTEIAKSIASLAQLFNEMSELVIDQGTILDSVQYNIEETAHDMEQSVVDLAVATRYQKNTGKRKCIFLLLLIIFGLIIVLILKPKGHPPPPSSSSSSSSQSPSTLSPPSRRTVSLFSRTRYSYPIGPHR